MSAIGGISYGNSQSYGYNNFGLGDTEKSGYQAGNINGNGKTKGTILNPGEEVEKSPGHKSSPAECETCKNRKYQDGSDEMVSFKSAAHISPEAAPAKVRSHEQEHVTNAYEKAEKDNGEVISCGVAIHTAVCPECGRTYVSGGTTTTHIKYSNEENPYQKDLKSAEAANKWLGANVNFAV
ncbi:MAG: hypothetical protein K6A23_02820 [Butyrivibrio sp.]|nr:hypothetical protein [Butyrivibrio sp.]